MRRVLVARCNGSERDSTSRNIRKQRQALRNMHLYGRRKDMYTVLLRIVLLGSADNKSCLSFDINARNRLTSNLGRHSESASPHHVPDSIHSLPQLPRIHTPTSLNPTISEREREKELPPIPLKIHARTHARTTMPPINLQPKLQHPAPPTKNSIISYPAPGVLLVHLNKPKDLNCINAEFTQELETIWLWLDEEPTLSVGIITGTGRAFCAGADLKGR